MKKHSEVTLTLAEYKAFADSLSDDWCFEGDDEIVSEMFWEGEFDPSETIVIPNGMICICWQGDKNPPKEQFLEFVDEFIRWKNKQTDEIIAVSVPKEKIKMLKDLIKKNGGKVL